MSTGILHATPVAVTAIVAFLIYFRKGERPARYTLPQQWTHAPILWAAVDEVVPGGHHGGLSDDVANVGGGASGRW